MFLKKGNRSSKVKLFQGYNIYYFILCTRIKSNSLALIWHLDCIIIVCHGVRLSPFPRVESRFNTHNQNAFANAFRKRLSRIVAFIIDLSESRLQNHDYRITYTVRPQKNRPLKQRDAVTKCRHGRGVWLQSYLHRKVWPLCFRMIHCWNSSNHPSLSSIVFKIECQNSFVPL